MWLNKLPRLWTAGPRSAAHGRRLTVEQLEDRSVPAGFTAASVADLIAAIDAANLTPEADTITLTPGKTFTLTAVNNSTHGPTGLPTIAAGENLTVVGNGDTIQRSTTTGTPPFRLFDAAGAWLTLQNLTLQGGLAAHPSYSVDYTEARGGAVYSQGILTLSGVTVQNNTAQGEPGGAAAGGGIWSAGSLVVEHSIIRNNQAVGGDGGADFGPGGWAAGGGLYFHSGTASLIDVTLTSNSARGGDGGDRVKVYLEGVKHSFSFIPATAGGNGLGGAIYAASGALSVHGSTVTHNVARGGTGGSNGNTKASDGVGLGGGLYLDAPVSADFDVFSQAHVKNNSPDDIVAVAYF